jgi:hypothetical protein
MADDAEEATKPEFEQQRLQLEERRFEAEKELREAELNAKNAEEHAQRKGLHFTAAIGYLNLKKDEQIVH